MATWLSVPEKSPAKDHRACLELVVVETYYLKLIA